MWTTIVVARLWLRHAWWCELQTNSSRWFNFGFVNWCSIFKTLFEIKIKYFRPQVTSHSQRTFRWSFWYEVEKIKNLDKNVSWKLLLYRSADNDKYAKKKRKNIGEIMILTAITKLHKNNQNKNSVNFKMKTAIVREKLNVLHVLENTYYWWPYKQQINCNV